MFLASPGPKPDGAVTTAASFELPATTEFAQAADLATTSILADTGGATVGAGVGSGVYEISAGGAAAQDVATPFTGRICRSRNC